MVVLLAGMATPFFGTERIGEIVTSLSELKLEVVRVIAALPSLLGAFLVYAINSEPRPAS